MVLRLKVFLKASEKQHFNIVGHSIKAQALIKSQVIEVLMLSLFKHSDKRLLSNIQRVKDYTLFLSCNRKFFSTMIASLTNP